MSLVLYKALAGLLIFITSLVSVIYPLRVHTHPTHHRLLEMGDALASGIFLGAALFHMLPEATMAFTSALGEIHYPLAELFCAAGFLLLLLFERISNRSNAHDGIALPYVIALIIIIHSLIEGAALGVNTILETASIIFLAIIVHKGSESFALAITLNRSKLNRYHVWSLVGVFALMTPLGIAMGTILTLFLQNQTSQLLTAGFNAFAAGTFLYMSTLHHINHHHRVHDSEGIIEFFVFLAGLSVMALLALWA